MIHINLLKPKRRDDPKLKKHIKIFEEDSNDNTRVQWDNTDLICACGKKLNPIRVST